MNLLPHQERAREIARERKKYILGWKPGLGKTMASLAICDERPMRTVVLCPKSILHSAWVRDAQNFPSLKTAVVHGSTPAKRSTLIRSDDWGVAITTYETWRKHADDYIAAGVRRLIVDEASKVRNPESKLTKAIIPFADRMDEVYLLSGTLAPNHCVEYWAALRTVAGPKSRTFWQFAHHYAHPVKKRRWGKDKNGRAKQIEYVATWQQTPQQEEMLKNVLARFCWFLRKEDCLSLPPQEDQIIEVDLSPAEEDAYLAAKHDLRLAVRESRTIQRESLLIKLRQITGGAVKVNDLEHEVIGHSKIDAMLELLEEIGDEPIVIWCEFTHEIDRVKEALEKSGRVCDTIDGRSSHRAGETAAAFQRGDIRAVVCHPAAAGHGITLTRASYCLFFALSFSAEQHEQAMNRIHRIGQDRPCTYYYLLTKVNGEETVDWRCHAVSKGKMTASAALEAEVGKLTGEKPCSTATAGSCTHSPRS